MIDQHFSRRRVLAALGGSAASALVPGGAADAATARAKAVRRMIDVHHHFFPPVVLDLFIAAIAKTGQANFVKTVNAWSPAVMLEEMDWNGIALALLSISNASYFWSEGAETARRLVRACNEYAAEMRRDHPGRFGLFACMPLPDVDATLAEIAYALDVLKADGIGIMTNYGDKWPGDPAFAAVFEELDRRKAIVVLHPLAANCCGSLIKNVPASWMEFPFDTSRAVASLLFSGTLARHRNLRIVAPHAGGTIPFLAGRIKISAVANGNVDAVAPQGTDYELKRLYYDVAGSATLPTMAALLKYVPLEHILFGTDFPYLSIEEISDNISRVGLSPAQLRAIERDNAARLVGMKA